MEEDELRGRNSKKEKTLTPKSKLQLNCVLFRLPAFQVQQHTQPDVGEYKLEGVVINNGVVIQ